ncbi:MAG: lipoyl(octanoyl) transferase LipB [Candidatus Eisenbacteria bacterium]|uniref:Octanoyltransferase n=1 Tax=Eiseniibacteriota bacterium TaxID=2212470 RepID=A0A9D6L9H2_UNCEI|nr:lipoyl(octanoyl) transferase LipB [Candidatus Eisenbacteria bacterium]MBI3540289.1 lipoyl(octanoyl) transferase LipB [Candidatus Eisenbacteria bacterium]
MTLNVCHLGATTYRDGLLLQEALVQARASGATGDWLLYPDHPPVLTVGRSGSEASLKVDRATLERMGIEVFDVARGGDFTWHGPGQLVGYAICDLTARDRDLHRFLRDLEAAIVAALAGWGLAGATVPGRTGVWVCGDKIASLGVAVRRWVSYHGFALNVAPDLKAFDVIHPCGLRGIQMTSLADRLGPQAPALSDARTVMASQLARQLGYDGWRWASADEARRAAGGAGRAPYESIAGLAR